MIKLDTSQKEQQVYINGLEDKCEKLTKELKDKDLIIKMKNIKVKEFENKILQLEDYYKAICQSSFDE